MNKLLSVFGWILATVGLVFALFSVLVLIDALTTPDEKSWSALMGMLLLTGLFGIPGGLLLWRTRLARGREEFNKRLIGFITSLDNFTVGELAGKIGRTELETNGLIATLISERAVDLAFHRQTGRYLHRGRLQRSYRIIDRCGSCGAAVGQELVFDGETPECSYCGVRLGSA